MAKSTMKMPDDFLDKISRLEKKTDEIVPKVLKAGAEVAEKAIKENLERVVGKDTKHKSQSTGQLVVALGTTKARLDREGNYDVKIGFAENRTDGKSNAMIANILEYGKSDQAPKPFLKPAKSQSRKGTIDAMVKKLEEELEKI